MPSLRATYVPSPGRSPTGRPACQDGLMREEGGPSRRRLSRDERRAQILDAAAGVFAERGYEATSIDEVAEAAGISKPVIYDHFDSKKDLHIALIDKQTDDLLLF